MIATLGGRGDAHHERASRPPRPAILQDAAVGRGGGVGRFVNDSGLEIRHQAGQPGAATQGLHTGHHDGGGMLITGCLHDPQGEGRIDQAQFVHGLRDELIPMGQDEGPATVPLHQEGKHNGFACARRQHEEGPLDPARRGGEPSRHRNVGDGIISQMHRDWLLPLL